MPGLGKAAPGCDTGKGHELLHGLYLCPQAKKSRGSVRFHESSPAHESLLLPGLSFHWEQALACSSAEGTEGQEPGQGRRGPWAGFRGHPSGEDISLPR